MRTITLLLGALSVCLGSSALAKSDLVPVLIHVEDAGTIDTPYLLVGPLSRRLTKGGSFVVCIAQPEDPSPHCAAREDRRSHCPQRQRCQFEFMVDSDRPVAVSVYSARNSLQDTVSGVARQIDRADIDWASRTSDWIEDVNARRWLWRESVLLASEEIGGADRHGLSALVRNHAVAVAPPGTVDPINGSLSAAFEEFALFGCADICALETVNLTIEVQS